MATEISSDIVATTIEEEPVPTDSEPVSRKISSSLASLVAPAPRSCQHQNRDNNNKRFGYHKHEIGCKLYSFLSNWQIKYPCIEYDSKSDIAFCYVCRLYHLSKRVWRTRFVRDTYTIAGFRNWKMTQANDTTRGFWQHFPSEMHIEAEARNAHTVFMVLEPDLGDMLIDCRKKQRATGRKAMMLLFDTTITLVRNGISFRGHTPEEGFLNQVLRIMPAWEISVYKTGCKGKLTGLQEKVSTS